MELSPRNERGRRMRIVRIVNLFFALAVATMLTAAVARAGPSRLVLESDPSLFNGELYQVTFDTFDDFRNNNPSSFGFSQLGIERDFSVGGFAHEFDPVPGEDPSDVSEPSTLPLMGFALAIAGFITSRTRQLG